MYSLRGRMLLERVAYSLVGGRLTAHEPMTSPDRIASLLSGSFFRDMDGTIRIANRQSGQSAEFRFQGAAEEVIGDLTDFVERELPRMRPPNPSRRELQHGWHDAYVFPNRSERHSVYIDEGPYANHRGEVSFTPIVTIRLRYRLSPLAIAAEPPLEEITGPRSS